ncbi:MAG TPA: protoporphyrinogen oxidase [Thermomicrobiales bacterium]|nr:protoporphyrinogen oxidase [Thermomicrobiales bacterium]
MPHVAVVGGGIAGLTAAHTLRELGADVTLFEASDRLGGKIHTERVGELLIDSGPDSFLSSKPAALQLVERLGLLDSVVDTLPDGGGTFILRDGRLLPLPEGLTLLVPADFTQIARSPLLSPIGKARMALDLLIPPRYDDADESISSFVRRRVGNQAFERMAEPLLSGIYAGDADALSLLSTFPRLRDIEREHRGVIRGAISQKRQARSRPTGNGPKRTPFVSLRGGLGELIDALAARLDPASVFLNAPVTRISRSSSGFEIEANGTTAAVDAILLAVPAPSASIALEQLDGEVAYALAGIAYVSSATVSLAFDARDVAGKQVGRGFVIPRAEGRTLTAVTWTSNKFGGRAPPGIALLRAFVGRAGNESPAFLPDDELIARACSELAVILDITAEPIVSRVYRWPNALPQYNLGHQERLARIDERIERLPGVALTGAAYRGIGIPDCIRDAQEQSERLFSRLTT